MTTLDYTGLRLVGALKMEHLTTLEFHVGVNEHGWAVVEGEAGENAVEQLQGAVAGQEQVILAQDESGAEQPLFAGIIRTASLITYGEYTHFRIELQSGTIQMDQVKRSRSFQDVKETYSQIAQKVASEYPDGAVIPTVGLDKPLGVPVIQYRETDWEFMKRMAIWCGGVVVPETHYSYPRLWFGFPERAFTCTFPEDCYTTGISQRYYELGGPVAGYERSDFLYYDVCSSQSCDLGWYTVFKGQEFLIYEKWGKMERGELIFTYRLGKPGLGWGRKRYNDKISGMTILGEVLSTERETVRLKLDIDEGWNPGGPYPYTWRPETGNMMYCMPQVGTRVSLYFPNYDEQMAMAVNCVRTNGGSCTRMSDPSKRSFVTEHGKEMNLYPQEMSLLGGANGMVKLEDETGISISTDKGIMVVALGPVSISGKVAVTTALMGEVVMAKGNILTGEMKTTQVQSNQYDLLAADFTCIEGWNQQTFEAYNDTPQEGSFDWGGLIGNVLAGIAVAAVVGLAVAASILFLPATIALISGTAIASGTMIAAGVIGGATFAAGVVATAGTTVNDVRNRQLSDRQTYKDTSYNAAATTGAVLQTLYGSYHLTKFLVQTSKIFTNLAKFLSTIGRSGVDGSRALAAAGAVGGNIVVTESSAATAVGSIGAILTGEQIASLVQGAGAILMASASGPHGKPGSSSGKSGVPVKERTRVSNGLYYQSNPKHTPGQPGNRPNAGIEPRNSLELFEQSVPSTQNPTQRYTYDSVSQTLHRFFSDGHGTWHWSGSTQQGSNSIPGSSVPTDIKRLFGLKMKGW